VTTASIPAKTTASPDLQRLERQVETTRDHWRKGQWFLCAVAALIMALAAARQIWFLFAIGGVMFAAFLWMSRAMLAKSNWDTNPALRTLRDRPHEIAEVKHTVASSSSGAFPHSFFMVYDSARNMYSFRVPDADKPEMVLTLRRLCPNATFKGPGFDARAR
jgi:hypothetical protein